MDLHYPCRFQPVNGDVNAKGMGKGETLKPYPTSLLIETALRGPLAFSCWKPLILTMERSAVVSSSLETICVLLLPSFNSTVSWQGWRALEGSSCFLRL